LVLPRPPLLCRDWCFPMMSNLHYTLQCYDVKWVRGYSKNCLCCMVWSAFTGSISKKCPSGAVCPFRFRSANRRLQDTTPRPTLLPIQRRRHSPSERSAPQRTLLRRSHAPSTGAQAACVSPRSVGIFCRSPAQPAPTPPCEAPCGRGIRLRSGWGYRVSPITTPIIPYR
jgi:hypothetical protein